MAGSVCVVLCVGPPMAPSVAAYIHEIRADELIRIGPDDVAFARLDWVVYYMCCTFFLLFQLMLTAPLWMSTANCRCFSAHRCV